MKAFIPWRPSFVLLVATGAFLTSCDQLPPTEAKSSPSAQPKLRPEVSEPSHAPTSTDTRMPLPLLPHMAQHQLANMREHLAAIQEILAALTTKDFEGVERAAARIGSSEEMSQMCNHMGRGAPGFTELALNFHRTADGIGTAAKARDDEGTLRAVSATLQTCVGCHATYRQQIVDAETWKSLKR